MPSKSTNFQQILNIASSGHMDTFQIITRQKSSINPKNTINLLDRFRYLQTKFFKFLNRVSTEHM